MGTLVGSDRRGRRERGWGRERRALGTCFRQAWCGVDYMASLLHLDMTSESDNSPVYRLGKEGSLKEISHLAE